MATVSDDFGGLTAGTNLNGRTVSSGTYTWTTSASGAFVGSSGGGSVTSNDGGGRNSATVNWVPAGTDYSVAGTLSCTTSGKNTLGLMARYQNSSNYLWAYWNGGNWQIWKRSGGTDSRLNLGSSGDVPYTAARAVILTVSGVSPNIAVSLDLSGGGNLASITGVNDTNLDPKGSVGMFNYFATTSNSNDVDLWSASDTVTSTTYHRLALLGVG